MTQIFEDDGTVVPVTVLRVEPNVVLQVRTAEKDGYEAVQIGSISKKKINKPMKGHSKDLGSFRMIRESKLLKLNDNDAKVGDKFDVSVFVPGDVVKISGLIKGKGFQGVVKRHGFSGMPASHGAHSVLRHAGSIGQRFPQHTLKGMRMAGRMGGVKRTTRGLKVVQVDAEAGLLAVRGAVPGNKGGYVVIQTQ